MSEIADITLYQLHATQQHHKVKIVKLEEFSHEADKSISHIISNQKMQQKVIDKLTDQVQKLLERYHEEKGAKNFLREILNSKILHGVIFLILGVLGSHNQYIQDLLNKFF